MQHISNWYHSQRIFKKYLSNTDWCLGHCAGCWRNRVKIMFLLFRGSYLFSSIPKHDSQKCHICFTVLMASRKRPCVVFFFFFPVSSSYLLSCSNYTRESLNCQPSRLPFVLSYNPFCPLLCSCITGSLTSSSPSSAVTTSKETWLPENPAGASTILFAGGPCRLWIKAGLNVFITYSHEMLPCIGQNSCLLCSTCP